jgi:transposase
MDDMIAPDCEVRAIDAIVDKMDIPSIGFTYSETKGTGRKPYNPVDMFKLYAYSYFNGIRSSRKIERECYRNIEVMWLINSLKPDFKTIADFRKNNKQPIK